MSEPAPCIVVLDGFTLSPLAPGETDPRHPSWDELAALGRLELHPRTPPAEIPARAAGAAIVLTNKAPLPRAVLEKLPGLRLVAVMATGTNIVDLAAARALGVAVCNVPGYAAPSAAQTVFALLLELCQRTGETALSVRAGRWSACPDFSYTLAPWSELEGKTFGVFGFGAIGARVARIAHGFGMKVLACSRTRKTADFPVAWTTAGEIFARADIISLHCPLTQETENLVNAETLARMKPGAILINTGRGGLVDEAAVAAALKSGRLGGYGADVLSREPPPADNPLPGAPRAVITPHLAWASIEARHRLMRELAENIRAFLAGRPRNLVGV